MRRRRPCSPLFPYTTLFRSGRIGEIVVLHPARLAAHEFVARPAFTGRNLGRRRRQRAGKQETGECRGAPRPSAEPDRKSTRLNSSHLGISYALLCLEKTTRH